MNYLDEWNEKQRASVEHWRRKDRELRQALARIVVRVSSRGGELGVTVDAEGKVTDIRLTPQALRLGEARLAHVLLDTVARAQSDAQRQAQVATAPFMADSGADTVLRFARELLTEDTSQSQRDR